MKDCRSIIAGCGHYLPSKVVSNHDMSKLVDTSDEWIFSRTGIRNRHFAADGELTSDLALAASKQALENANTNADEIDVIIVATVTPDRTFPATATKIQAQLGNRTAMAYDVGAACGGFLFALSNANNYIRLGQATTALVIGAETFSRIMDMKDRSTCVLFGDGAGAVVLKASDDPTRGIIDVSLHSDGQFQDILYTDGGPSTTGTTGYIRMEGREVFRHAVSKLADSAIDTLSKHSLTADDIDWFIPHQANTRIIDAVAKRLDLSTDKIINTVDRHANTSAASIPLALSESVAAGKVKPGQLILHEAFGAGLVWGSALIRW